MDDVAMYIGLLICKISLHLGAYTFYRTNRCYCVQYAHTFGGTCYQARNMLDIGHLTLWFSFSLATIIIWQLITQVRNGENERIR